MPHAIWKETRAHHVALVHGDALAVLAEAVQRLHQSAVLARQRVHLRAHAPQCLSIVIDTTDPDSLQRNRLFLPACWQERLQAPAALSRVCLRPLHKHVSCGLAAPLQAEHAIGNATL